MCIRSSRFSFSFFGICLFFFFFLSGNVFFSSFSFLSADTVRRSSHHTLSEDDKDNTNQRSKRRAPALVISFVFLAATVGTRFFKKNRTCVPLLNIALLFDRSLSCKQCDNRTSFPESTGRYPRYLCF